jgi:hypothetical protein
MIKLDVFSSLQYRINDSYKHTTVSKSISTDYNCLLVLLNLSSISPHNVAIIAVSRQFNFKYSPLASDLVLDFSDLSFLIKVR